MRTAVVVINKNGEALAERLKKTIKGAKVINIKTPLYRKKSLTDITEKIFSDYGGVVFCAAVGIVVRVISPFIKNKHSDPAVVCVDTAGRYAISVLSGHEGGANSLAYKVAASLGAHPVITTGSEVHRKFIVGVGCRRGIETYRVKKAIKAVLRSNNLTLRQVRLAATVDLKKDEKGLISACEILGLPLVFFSREQITRFRTDGRGSEIVKRNIGVYGVCEPCALLAGRRTKLISPKQIIDGVTVAVAKES